jgi:hypothetical protein
LPQDDVFDPEAGDGLGSDRANNKLTMRALKTFGFGGYEHQLLRHACPEIPETSPSALDTLPRSVS